MSNMRREVVTKNMENVGHLFNIFDDVSMATNPFRLPGRTGGGSEGSRSSRSEVDCEGCFELGRGIRMRSGPEEDEDAATDVVAIGKDVERTTRSGGAKWLERTTCFRSAERVEGPDTTDVESGLDAVTDVVAIGNDVERTTSSGGAKRVE